MVLLSILNRYITLRRSLRKYYCELVVANKQPQNGLSPSTFRQRDHVLASPLSFYGSSSPALAAPEMLMLEKELQSLQLLAATTTPLNARSTLVAGDAAPLTEPKEVNLAVGGGDEEDENNTPDKQHIAKVSAGGRLAYFSSSKKETLATAKPQPSTSASPSSRKALGSISSNTRTEPQRWRVNHKPVDTLSTDEVAVALLSKFA